MLSADLVLRGGRVIDPETGLDAPRDVGIRGDRIVAVTQDPLDGRRVVDVAGLVVAPGFVDLHSHGQALAECRLQALDGVTTALELEAGAAPVAHAYRRSAEEGRPINYGFSASWAAARMHVVGGGPLSGWPLEQISARLGADAWRAPATPAQTDRLLAVLEHELADGALGIGLLIGYAPATDPAEYVRVAELAARAGAPTFTHARPLAEQDPGVAVDGADEITRVAAETGAHMHYCHINSTSARHLDRVQALVEKVRAEGARVTTEAYPYGAGMTAIGADYFAPDRLHVLGATGTPSDVVYVRTGETVASVERLAELRAADPGGLAFIKTFDEDGAPDRLAGLVGLPGAVVASDAVPLVCEPGHVFDPASWPLPDFVRTHPRGAGTFARTLRIARETGALSLPDAIARCSLEPARIVERAAPALRRKGRVQVGCDADLVVFDPSAVTDNATYADTVRPSSGFAWVLVNGVPVVADGELVQSARPGRAIRRDAR
ncbi:amidohydrolase family protein [Cryptosporangium phraense]|uniref:amidohydrolase family protein n=1 Tax=Cryptosporangium phraense TaxID=2593070 RepID=UPI00197AC9FE|nr:amidohydrolase family protein [Cryptosporangium phraense]